MSRELAKTIFYRVSTAPAWLGLSPEQRDAFVQSVLRPLLARYPKVRLRYFDAEAYCATTTDVLMWQVESERDYQALVEALGETAFWGTYFEIHEIIVTVEDGFAHHYGFAPFSG